MYKIGRRHALFILALQSIHQSTVAASTLSIRLDASGIEQSGKAPSLLRGGDLSATPSSSLKRKKKRKSKKASQQSQSMKHVIANAMEKDPKEALGDAIRERADILRDDDPLLKSIAWSLSSVGHAVGASDHRMSGGGVEAAPTSIIVNYFLKSHGGLHGFQFLCSFLATVSGLGVLVFKNTPQAFIMLQRTMIFAMIKHISGVFVASGMAARAVTKIGLNNARQLMEELALDPVSQYVFFTALVLVWLPPKLKLDECWWWGKTPFVTMIVGPILIREIVSNVLVVSDVLVLLSISADSKLVDNVLKVTNSGANAMMSLLVSAKTWRAADARKRQAILANLVSQTSLAMEVCFGMLMLADTIYAISKFAFSSGHARPSIRETINRLLCVRLYIHFLWVRRKKISKVATNVRGGALALPFWLLEIIDHPLNAIGVKGGKTSFAKGGEFDLKSWQDFATTALAIE